ncbi:hypothetical protein [Thermomonospora cellulosilytica]|uniref:Membrane-associated oxidoreductase n=1 Tax=Thermomonospora cellulosilytica TaxID=1411118 RepID=A0A7W3R7H0_9ACTN|nr:hypothetical protein [Thermomonospora cellulosilytica]MBA9002504.1 hypothetical protein [Thermomonospora cellulosilytica]
MDLTVPERLLWDAYPTGRHVVLGTDRPAGPLPDRTVRAEVVSRLLLGAGEQRPGHVPAVRLRGAYVTGRLDVSGGTVECELLLDHCVLEEEPDFSNAQTRQMRMSNCTMPGFDGGGLRADGFLSLSGSRIDGSVRLPRAQLAGGLRMNRTRVTETEPNRWAVFAGGTVVDAGAFLRDAEITGGLRLTGARMNGGLFMEGAALRNPGRIALDAQNIVVEDAAELSHGFTAEGMVRLRSGQVNGTLSFDRAGAMRNPGKVVLHLSHMQADELILTPDEPVEGVVTLVYSRIGVLLDRPDRWPARLRLQGLVYESLRGGGVTERIDWVSRDVEGFRPQPYEQLAAWYRRDGNDHLARRALLAKQRARRRSLPPRSRAWGFLLDATVGYGYRPWLAAGWLAAVLTAGTVLFGIFPPNPLKQPAERPDFHSFVYTLDLLIPFGAFGQREAWDPAGWTQWLAYGLIACGWILATALIAGATRVLRPA